MRLILILIILICGESLYGQSVKGEKIYSSKWIIGKEDVQLDIYRFDSIAATKQYVGRELMYLSMGPKELLYTDRNAYYLHDSNHSIILRVRQGRFYANIYTKKKKTAFDIAKTFLSGLPDYLSYPPPPPPTESEVEEKFKVIKVFPSFSKECDSLKENAWRVNCLKQQVEKQLSQLIEYPEIIKKKKRTGTIVVSYFVDNNGTLSDIKILEDEEGFGENIRVALNKIDLQPKWAPAKARGRNIRFEVIHHIKLP